MNKTKTQVTQEEFERICAGIARGIRWVYTELETIDYFEEGDRFFSVFDTDTREVENFWCNGYGNYEEDLSDLRRCCLSNNFVVLCSVPMLDFEDDSTVTAFIHEHMTKDYTVDELIEAYSEWCMGCMKDALYSLFEVVS